MKNTWVHLRALLAAALLLTLWSAAPAAQAEVHPPGSLLSVGDNGFGQLGSGSFAARTSVGPVVGLDDVVEMHSGREHVVALTSTGAVATWGSNQMGQLGTSGGHRNTPALVPGITGATAVSTGHYHSLAVTAAGNVLAWGNNANGQLGDGSRSNSNSPVQVLGLSDVRLVAAGRDMSYAVRNDGTVWAWGDNAYAELGDGTTSDRLTPVRVSGLTDVVAIAGGRDHGLAVRANGTAWTWGWNRFGQLGDGTTTNRATPVQVLSGATSVIAGAHHSYALRSNGTVASWGRNYRAELGDGTTRTRLTPVTVSGVSDAVAIGTGRDHGLAVIDDGTVKVWGEDAEGQLGDGSTTNRTTAITMPGVSSAVAVSGGSGHSIVQLGPSGPPVNADPQARMTISCNNLVCSFDGRASTDDGSIVSYEWDFGDGATGSGALTPHTYAGPGNYLVRLEVTDNEDATDSASQQQQVNDAPPPSSIEHRASASSNANTTSPSVRVPNSVEQGDVVVLVVTANRDTTVGTPNGWTLADTVRDGSVESWLFWRSAGGNLAGSDVSPSLGGRSKVSMALSAYAGASSVTAVRGATRSGTSSSMTAPSAPVTGSAGWVVAYFADKTSSNTTWSVPSGTTRRELSAGSGGGRVTAQLVDQGPVGSWSGATAVSGASGSKALAWSVVVE